MSLNRGLILIFITVNLNNLLSISSTASQGLESNENRNTKLNETWEDILKRDLLVNYDKNSRPSPHQNRTQVTLNLSVKHIDLDELKGVVNLFGWMKMVWQDEKLKWNASEYGGNARIRVSSYEIWQPNLIVYNKATGNDIDHLGNTLMIVYNNGWVLWVPPFQASFFCELDFHLWPFDTQKCDLIFGSWILDDNDILLQTQKYDSGSVKIEPYIENTEWQIKNITAIDKLPQFKSAIKYKIILERRSPMYKAVVITPASCIILLTLSCFWLPPQSGEKIMLNGANIICITGFLLYFAQMLPTLAMNTPLVVLFYSSTLLIVTTSMIISVVIMFIANTKHKRKIPSILKKLLDGSFGKILCLMRINMQSSSSTDEFEKELQDQNFGISSHGVDDDHRIINSACNHQSLKKSIQHDWIILAMAIDRLCFLIYSIIFIILAAVYAV